MLRHVSRRLRSLDVNAVEADVLKPLPVHGSFDSAALHAVIHCLPGPPERKSAAIANVAAVLAPAGTLLGASVIGTSGQHRWIARRFLDIFIRQGGFDNLSASFEHVELEAIGSVVVFAATSPRAAAGTSG